MSMKRFYNTTMKIRRENFPTTDSVGGIVQTVTADITVPCRIRLLNASERTVSGRDGVSSTHRIYAPVGTSIAPKDVVRINGDIYDVSFADDPQGLGKFLQIDCVRRY